MLPSVPDFAAACFGVLRAGCLVVPVNPLLKPARWPTTWATLMLE